MKFTPTETCKTIGAIRAQAFEKKLKAKCLIWIEVIKGRFKIGDNKTPVYELLHEKYLRNVTD